MHVPLGDARLAAAAKLVRPGSVVADIGADHGHLVCYLVGNGICPRGFACDIAEGPLENARGTIAEHGLGDRVKAVLTNGLTGLALDEIDDIVIAGMGGELIAEILSASPGAQDGRLRFILQPMTKAERLRRLLYRMGFVLEEEHAVREKDFLYTVMVARFTGEQQEIDELFAWTGCLPQKNTPENREMLQKIRARLAEIADGLDRSERLAASSERYRRLLGELDNMRSEESSCLTR